MITHLSALHLKRDGIAFDAFRRMFERAFEAGDSPIAQNAVQGIAARADGSPFGIVDDDRINGPRYVNGCAVENKWLNFGCCAVELR